jgi:hypothetical protein
MPGLFLGVRRTRRSIPVEKLVDRWSAGGPKFR